MDAYKKYLEYLKDNPKGYWFKRKLYGWGWTPATTQGWIVFLIYLLFVIVVAFGFNEGAGEVESIRKLFVLLTTATVVLIWVIYLKGEKPKWQWGKRIND
jgi:hypothetical protein